MNWRSFWGNGAAAVALLAAQVITGAARATDAVYVQSGDVSARGAVVWARCNAERGARIEVDFAPEDDFDRDRNLRKKVGPPVSDATDYTGSVKLGRLEPNTRYRYQVACVSDGGEVDGVAVGSFRTAPAEDDDEAVRFVWAADLAGQGWGRNPELALDTADGRVEGGYAIFEVMRRLQPDFAIFQGDMIYADNAAPPTRDIPAEVGGGAWVNDPPKDFVAITLDQYRENWKYNLGDEKLRHFLSEVPVYAQWDDHEVVNNWYPGEILANPPYNGISADVLAERSRQALFEYNPIGGDFIFRNFQQGEHLEVFLLDERSFRGPNPDNSNPAGNAMLGRAQLDWLERNLKRSKATWKVISTHDPLSIVTGGPGDRDAWGQGEPEVLGRELELAELLRFLRNEDIANVVFITSDVHFAAVISYAPSRSVFPEFEPFFEFVIGPVHAGAFGPGALDPTFGPRYDAVRAPDTEALPQNLPPPHFQSFGAAEVGEDGRLQVTLYDATGAPLFASTLDPRAPAVGSDDDGEQDRREDEGRSARSD